MPQKQTTWVATFDGQHGRVYALGGDGNLRHLDAEGMDAQADTEQRPDAPDRKAPPGRASGDTAVSTEATFVRTFTDRLEKRAKSGAFDRLIVSADPRALATFRKACNGALKDKITVELNKDYTHTPVKQLEAVLSEHL